VQNQLVGLQLFKISANAEGGYTESLCQFFHGQFGLQRMQLRQHLRLTFTWLHSPPGCIHGNRRTHDYTLMTQHHRGSVIGPPLSYFVNPILNTVIE